jgi:hypothetical protein
LASLLVIATLRLGRTIVLPIVVRDHVPMLAHVGELLDS